MILINTQVLPTLFRAALKHNEILNAQSAAEKFKDFGNWAVLVKWKM